MAAVPEPGVPGGTLQTRPISAADYAEVLDLNHESVHYLSPLSREGLEKLLEQAPLHRVLESDGRVLAFIIVLQQGAHYGSVNYQWFAQRYPSFLYVDRVVVSRTRQARGAGSVLYREVFGFARQHGFTCVACEYDVQPPNPGSARFHARFGFAEVGRQTVANGSKTVSLQLASAPFSEAA